MQSSNCFEMNGGDDGTRTRAAVVTERESTAGAHIISMSRAPVGPAIVANASWRHTRPAAFVALLLFRHYLARSEDLAEANKTRRVRLR